MNLEKLKEVESKAEEFLRRLKIARAKMTIIEYCSGSKETAALKRQSLDLTRELAEMRRPG